MARSRVNKQYLNWKGGLNTEKSRLTGDTTTFKSGENIVINRKGEISRRLSFSMESTTFYGEDFINISLNKNTNIQTFLWTNVGGNADKEMLLVRIGLKIKFYDATKNILSEGHLPALSIDFSTLATVPELAISEPISGTFGNEFFFIAGKHIEPFYLKYIEKDNSDDSERIQFQEIDIKIRDLDGLDTQFNDDENVEAFTTLNSFNKNENQEEEVVHLYNLLNQGWGNYKELSEDNVSSNITQKLEDIDFNKYFGKLTKYMEDGNDELEGINYPSNVESSQGFKDENGDFSAVEIVKTEFGNSHSAKGHFILNAFNKERSAVSAPLKTIRAVGDSSITKRKKRKKTIHAHKSVKTGTDSIRILNEVDALLEKGYKNIGLYSLAWNAVIDQIRNDVQNTGTTDVVIQGHSTYIGYEDIDIAQNISSYELEDINYEEQGFNSLSEAINEWIPNEIIKERPTNIEFFAGRVWYSMFGKVFFSQLIKDEKNMGKCYQEQDPTAEILNTLLDTDGGEIQIKGCADIINMMDLGHYLIIFASNGIWAVRGGQNGFTATSYLVDRLSDIKIDSRESIVRVNNRILLWSREGILQIGFGKNGFEIGNISENTIQTYYNELSGGAKLNVRSVYNDKERKVYWFYRNSSNLDVLDSLRVNEMLILDLTLNNFTIQTVSTDENAPYVIDLFVRKTSGNFLNQIPVVANGEQVEVNGEQVVITSNKRREADFDVSFLTLADYFDPGERVVAFAKVNGLGFLDWGTNDYSSFIETEYEGLEDVIHTKKASYIHALFNRTENGFEEDGDGGLKYSNESSCILTSKWDWTSIDVGRWTKEQQIYRLPRHYTPTSESDNFNYGFDVIATKTKIRGKGKVLSNRFESETGKDMQLLGFAIEYSTRR